MSIQDLFPNPAQERSLSLSQSAFHHHVPSYISSVALQFRPACDLFCCSPITLTYPEVSSSCKQVCPLSCAFPGTWNCLPEHLRYVSPSNSMFSSKPLAQAQPPVVFFYPAATKSWCLHRNKEMHLCPLVTLPHHPFPASGTFLFCPFLDCALRPGTHVL